MKVFTLFSTDIGLAAGFEPSNWSEPTEGRSAKLSPHDEYTVLALVLYLSFNSNPNKAREVIKSGHIAIDFSPGITG